MTYWGKSTSTSTTIISFNVTNPAVTSKIIADVVSFPLVFKLTCSTTVLSLIPLMVKPSLSTFNFSLILNLPSNKTISLPVPAAWIAALICFESFVPSQT